jgi:uncharacterized protein (DUF952 family)
MTALLLDRVLEAESSNALLSGPLLRRAGIDLAKFALTADSLLLSIDQAGARIIGVALSGSESVHAADSTRRFDGQSITLVSGYIVGSAGIAQAARTARALGADQVHAVLLGAWDDPIDACDTVITELGTAGRHLRAV